jgi:hypothetical protein
MWQMPAPAALWGEGGPQLGHSAPRFDAPRILCKGRWANVKLLTLRTQAAPGTPSLLTGAAKVVDGPCKGQPALPGARGGMEACCRLTTGLGGVTVLYMWRGREGANRGEGEVRR